MLANNEILYTALFYALSLAAVLSALLMVCTKKILRSAAYLMAVLSMTAGYYMLLGQEFMAGVQILVYVGGIVVLFVFAVMLTRSVELDEATEGVIGVALTIGGIVRLVFA